MSGAVYRHLCTDAQSDIIFMGKCVSTVHRKHLLMDTFAIVQTIGNIVLSGHITNL